MERVSKGAELLIFRFHSHKGTAHGMDSVVRISAQAVGRLSGKPELSSRQSTKPILRVLARDPDVAIWGEVAHITISHPDGEDKDEA